MWLISDLFGSSVKTLHLIIILIANMEKMNINTNKIMRKPIWGTLHGSCIFSFCELSLLFIKMTPHIYIYIVLEVILKQKKKYVSISISII